VHVSRCAPACHLSHGQIVADPVIIPAPRTLGHPRQPRSEGGLYGDGSAGDLSAASES